MGKWRSGRRPRVGHALIVLVAVSLGAAVFSFGVGPALASSTSYTCTGNQGIDEPAVDAAINSFAVVTINGPTACYGNFIANNMNVTIQGGTQPAVLYGSAQI